MSDPADGWESLDLTSVAAAACSYTRAGLRVIPVHAPIVNSTGTRCTCGQAGCAAVGKHPVAKRGWPAQRLAEADLPAHFETQVPRNVGVLTGEPSGGLVDVDLDCPEAVALAPAFLPTTGCVYGRASTPRSHYLYVAIPACSTTAFKDPDNRTLLELRGTKSQTVFPPSLHASGEFVQFALQGRPPITDYPALRRRASLCAAACLLLRGWPREKGGRWKRAHALAGGLLRAGWSVEDVQHLVRAVAEAAGDDEVEARVHAVEVTKQKLDAGEAASGWPALAELIGGPAVASIRTFLGAKHRDRSAAAGPNDTPPTALYKRTDQGLLYLKPTANGVAPLRLCNFNASIVADVATDDGVETRRDFEIEASLVSGPPMRFAVAADEFAAMHWPLKRLGARAIVHVGHSNAAHVAAAVQMLSADIVERRIFAHSGWREIDGQWKYLHAGGAISAAGLEAGIETFLPGTLQHLSLPQPPSGEDLTTAIQASFELLRLGPERIVYPALAAVFRAAIGGADFSIFIVGPTGTFKSEFASLLQRYFGTTFDARNLPGSWSSTANALEDLAFRAKDALFVVDDFKPAGDAIGDAKLHQQADRLLRAQGNHSGRQRMRADGSLRPVRPPRGLIVSTGEELPRGESLRARLITLEVSPGDIDSERLTGRQREAERGEYVLAMSAFLQWMASRRTAILDRFRARANAARIAFHVGHARHALSLAELLAAFELFMQFAVEATGENAITRAEADGETESCRKALLELASRQVSHVVAAEPAGRFLELLGSAIASGRAHVASATGDRPEGAQAWGWHEFDNNRWESRGDRVGWLDGDDLYLDPSAAYKVAANQAPPGAGIAVGEHTLRKRLHERGHLVSTDETRETLTVRRVLQSKRRAVLHLRADALGPPGAGDLPHDDLPPF